MRIPFTNIEIGASSEKKEVEVKSDAIFDLGGSLIYGQTYPIVSKSFDGEKTPGELGVVLNSVPDYNRLRIRAYDAEMRSDLVKIITERFFQWVVGSGLKLQAEPNEDLLKLENITEDWELFKTSIESRFNVYSKSKFSDYSNMQNLHQKALEAYKTAFIGGDCLVICRIENSMLSVQIVDGTHIQTPYTTNYITEATKRGNHIAHGIEIDKKGQHIAFYIKQKNLKFERVPVYGEKSKRKLAWLIYGEKKRVDHVRGISQLSQVLEKLNKLDRYTEASVGKAEQAANIAYTIEHDNYSTGEGIVEKTLQQKMKVTGTVQDGYALADGLANRISETTSNQTFNMPVGAKMKAFGTQIETNFEQFYSAILNTLCASIGVPSEVAMQMYNSNYSASRAAINSFGYVVDLGRDKFSEDFYKPIYKIYLELEVLKNKVPANGLISALQKEDLMIIEAYSQCRFIGKNMPHIDPLKEVKAVREMIELGILSREQATEDLNKGDFKTNNEKIIKESKVIYKPEIPDTNGTI